VNVGVGVGVWLGVGVTVKVEVKLGVGVRLGVVEGFLIFTPKVSLPIWASSSHDPI
jgi:hypothetical protein